MLVLILFLLFVQDGFAQAGEWKSKHKCPKGYLATPFRTRDKTLYIAKRDCAKACDSNDKCRFADLYWTRYGQTCYLRTDQCGDWQNNTHGSYLLYIKGGPTPTPAPVTPTPAPVDTCFNESQMRYELAIAVGGKSTEQTALACQKRCAATEKCNYFNFFVNGKGCYLGACYKRKYKVTSGGVNVRSGPGLCDEG